MLLRSAQSGANFGGVPRQPGRARPCTKHLVSMSACVRCCAAELPQLAACCLLNFGNLLSEETVLSGEVERGLFVVITPVLFANFVLSGHLAWWDAPIFPAQPRGWWCLFKSYE